MKKIEFNLLEEPWIRVRTPDCALQKVSLTDALLHAHEYAGLAGELPTQDVAVLRLFGSAAKPSFTEWIWKAPFSLTDEEDALDRWGQLWEEKLAARKAHPWIYATAWRERF